MIKTRIGKNRKALNFCLALAVAGVLLFSQFSQAANGLRVGQSSLNLTASESLIFGNISSASATTSKLLLLQNAGTPKFTVDYYGNLTTPATVTAGAISGPMSGTLNAANVSSGPFGSNTGGGNFSFPAKVGIGTANPSQSLEIIGKTNIAPINLVYNGSFENGLTTGWTLGQMTVDNSTSQAYSGSRSLRIYNLSWDWGAAYFSIPNPEKYIGKRLSFSLWMRGDSSNYLNTDYQTGYPHFGTNADTFSWSTSNSSNADGFTAARLQSNNWYNYTGSFIVPAGTTSLYLSVPIWIGRTPTAYGTNLAGIYIDDVMVTVGAALDYSPLARGIDEGILFSGNLGIGTTGPASKLHIFNTGSGDGTWNQGILIENSNATPGETALSFRNSSTASSYWFTGLNQGVDYNISYGTSFTDATTKLRITSNGNVGIGTTNPGADLQIGSGGLGYIDRTRMIIQPPGHTGGPWKIAARDDSTVAYLDFAYGTSKALTLNSSGSFGIGTTNPDYKLDVQGSFGTIRIKSTTSTNYANLFINNGGGDLYFGRDSSAGGQLATGSGAYAGVINAQGTYPLQFAVNNAIGLTMLNGGNVGIGTTAPGAKLQVSTSFKANTAMITGLGSAGKVLVMADNSGNLFSTTTAAILPPGSVALPSGTSGQTLRRSSTAWTADSNLYNNGTNVGIGTTGPGGKLEVYGGNLKVNGGDILFSMTAGQTATRLVSYSNASGLWLVQPTAQSLILADNIDWDRSMAIQYTAGTTGAVSGRLVIGQTLKNSATYTHGITSFYTNGAEQLRINSSGNVGIGSTAPSAKLDLSGGFFKALGGTVTGLGSGGNVLVMADNSGNLFSTSTSAFLSSNSGWTVSGTNVYKTDVNGNIGIGTNNPTNKLEVRYGASLTSINTGAITVDVAGNFENGLSMTNKAAGFAGPMAAVTAVPAGYGSNSSASLIFRTNTGSDALPTEKMRILANGSVGIGTASPLAKFQVNGNSILGNAFSAAAINGSNIINILSGSGGVASTTGISFWEDTTSAMKISYDGSGAGATNALRIYDFNNNPLVSFQNGGNVGIGSITPGAKLDVVGTFRNTLSTTHSLLGGAGNAVVMTDNSGTLFSSSPASLGVVSQYDFVVNGDANTFYPVVLQLQPLSTSYVTNFSIFRGYSEQAPDTWYSSTHHGGLTLDISARYGGWGGYTNMYKVNYFGESYSRILAKVGYTAHTMGFAVWLRGGGAVYHLRSSSITAAPTVYDSGSGPWLVYDDSNPYYDVYESSISWANKDAELGSVSTNNTVVGTGSGNYLAKWTDGYKIANSTIFDNGTNVGIGTTAPGGKLDVTVTPGDSWQKFVVTTTSQWGDGSSQYITLGAGGASGIMLSNPHVTWADSSGAHLRMGRSGGVSTGAYYDIGTRSNDAWSIQKNASETGLFYINSAGNIGIGTTNPGNKLSINYQASTTNPNNSSTLSIGTSASIFGSASDATVNGQILFPGSGWEHAYITYYPHKTDGIGYFRLAGQQSVYGDINVGLLVSGNVGIGSTAPGAKLEVSTSLKANSAMFTGLGSAGNVLVMSDNSGNLFATSTAAFLSTNSGWTLNGTNIYKTNTTGNVGIGTTNPSTAKLAILGGEGTYAAPNFGSANLGAINILNTTSDRRNAITFSSHGANNAQAGIYVHQDSSAGTHMYLATTDSYATGPQARLTILNNGNIGIGTITPGYKLDVNGVMRAERYRGINSLALATYATANPSSNVFLYSQPNDRDSWIYLDSADTGSNWGIYHRQIDSAVSGLPGNSIGFVGGGSSALQAYISLANGSAYFNGNVGIGSATPGAKLDVSGNLRSSSLAGAGNVTVMADNGGALYTANMWLPNGTHIYSNNSGNVGIGTNSPTAKLQVNGSAIFNANNSFNNRKIFTITRDIATGAGSWVNLGSVVSNSQGTYITIYQSHHHGGTINAAVYEISDVYYAGATTDWMQVPTSNYRSFSGVQDYAIDVRRTATSGTANLEIRARVLSSSPGAGTLQFEIQTNGTFSADSTSGTGATVVGYLSNNAYQFPVSNDRFKASSDGLFMLNTGNVGIGTTNPGAKLHVNGSFRSSSALVSGLAGSGQVVVMADNSGSLYATSTSSFFNRYVTGDLNLGNHNITNVNKLTVNTIDPLYSISGKKYSTYASSLAGGVKEEYVGRLYIGQEISEGGQRVYENILDFAKIEAGSDLWVWRQVVDFSRDNVEVLITPYGSFASTYYVISDNQIVFRSSAPVEVSYRLIGKRFDWRLWPTFQPNAQEKGLLVR